MCFLEYIELGDIIIADGGFNIGDELALRRAKLEIPSFTKGKKQLTQEEVEKSRQLAKFEFMLNVSLDSFGKNTRSSRAYC